MSFLMLVPHSLAYCRIVFSFEIRMCESSNFILIFLVVALGITINILTYHYLVQVNANLI